MYNVHSPADLRSNHTEFPSSTASYRSQHSKEHRHEPVPWSRQTGRSEDDVTPRGNISMSSAK